MPNFDLVRLFTDNAVEIAIGVAVAAAGAALRAVFAKIPEVQADAQVVADVIAFMEPKAAQLEKVQMPGADKAGLVLRAAGKFLDDQGIRGDARAAVDKDLPALLEKALANVRAAAQPAPAK